MDAGKPGFSPQAASGSQQADGFAVFRLLLPQSFSDADTMDLYAAVNPLRRRTPSLQVRVEPLDSSASDADAIRVAVVLGPTAPVRRLEASSSAGEALALSPVQEALVAVVDAEGALHRADEAGRGAPGTVTCLLLVEASQLEAAAGRGVMGRIALETGAGVRVVPWEANAPSPRGQQPEEASRSTVRKGLVALSSCLQCDQPAGSSSSVKKDGSMLPWASSEMPEPSTGTFCSEASREHEQSSIPQFKCPQSVTGNVQTKGLQQISFRLLCPINIAGGLIGKKGLIIKGIEEETGACIDISAPLSGCSERLITISALEITGELMNVRDALCLVSWKLRNHVFSSKINNNKSCCVPTSNIAESNAASQVNISSTGQYSTDRYHRVDSESSPGYGMESVEKSFSDLQITSSEVQKAENDNGNGINNSDNGKWSDNGINKPYNGIASIEENNLITGADVSVYNPSAEGTEATIVVSGPPDNAQSAQRLLVDFILQGQA
ncbi:hypothetical protein PR202_gb25385 [Eleusine coracana subsp. coracana]|uniref:K Homology domain-containing protein n=1 Tax=Eleusine coracana subsp. coracana TaxID=191504 RepID=A0AAV5FNF1_ELECO|nr:hypothetical protein PR202_gb25385 [Eleusine coracana subsp. coracana]